MRRLVLIAAGLTILAAGAGGLAVAATSATVEIGATLQPQTLDATVGEAIRWHNATAVTQTVAIGGLSIPVAPGTTSTTAWTAPAAGTYSYTVHAQGKPLSGSVIVAAVATPTPTAKATATPRPTPTPTPIARASGSASPSPSGSPSPGASATSASSADASGSAQASASAGAGAVAGATANAGAGGSDSILLAIVALLLVVVGALSAMLYQARREPPSDPGGA